MTVKKIPVEKESCDGCMYDLGWKCDAPYEKMSECEEHDEVTHNIQHYIFVEEV